MQLPKKMKCIKIMKYGGPENLKYSMVDLPAMASNKVLIKVFAAGVNRPDILQRKGLYTPPNGASKLPGLEVSGKIISLGKNVTGFKKTDNVCALTHGGGYAEYCSVHFKHVLKNPKGYNFVESAAIPETFFTVWANLFKIGKLKKNETVLIHGGSSGIGTTAIQMAKINGSKVITTAGSIKKVKYCSQLGADLAIDYNKKDYLEEVLEFTKEKGVDVILDMVGGDYIKKNISLLKDKGRHITIAFLKGKDATIDLQKIIKNRLVITGSTLRPRTDKEKAELANAIKRIYWPLLEKRILKPVIYKTFSLRNAKEAHKLMESSKHIGKIILNIKTKEKK